MPLKWSTKAPMEYSFDREAPMASRNKPQVQRVAIAAIAVTMAWLMTARADDVLDRNVPFHIPASPLASALIEFSGQSGLQVAAADAEISHLNANGVNGTFAIRAALSQLLQGTGLEFSRVGAGTVAIRTASGPPVGGASAAPEIPDATVTAPRPPTDAE